MKNINKQSGSAHIVIIIILVVALVGTLGFVFWQNFIHKTPTTANTTATTQTTSATTKSTQADTTTTAPASQTADSGQYLTISRWGVKFPYTGSDTPYEVGHDGDTNNAPIATNQLDAANCGGAGTIYRGAATDPVWTSEGPGNASDQPTFNDVYSHPGTYVYHPGNYPLKASKVGSYYYVFIRTTSACDNETLQQTTVDTVQAAVLAAKAN